MSAVQEAKGKVLKSLKNQIEPLKQKGEKLFYPRDINKYMGWLKKYDEIVDHLVENSDKYGNITYEKGAAIIPKNFPFGNLVHRDTPGNKFAGQQKAYREAYKGAVELIQSTPNILFSPSRT